MGKSREILIFFDAVLNCGFSRIQRIVADFGFLGLWTSAPVNATRAFTPLISGRNVYSIATPTQI